MSSACMSDKVENQGFNLLFDAILYRLALAEIDLRYPSAGSSLRRAPHLYAVRFLFSRACRGVIKSVEIFCLPQARQTSQDQSFRMPGCTSTSATAFMRHGLDNV